MRIVARKHDCHPTIRAICSSSIITATSTRLGRHVGWSGKPAVTGTDLAAQELAALDTNDRQVNRGFVSLDRELDHGPWQPRGLLWCVERSGFAPSSATAA